MATEEDLEKKAKDEDADEADEAAALAGPAKDAAEADVRPKLDSEPGDRDLAEAAASADAPVQLGYMRFVYAAYMGGAMIVAFLVAKIGHAGWYKLGQWKPEFGEPHDELLYIPAAIIGILVAVYYWRKPESKQYATEVAEELSKVTWPSRKEVTSSTAVVVATTVVMTVFFALMDQFWRYVTDKIYSW